MELSELRVGDPAFVINGHRSNLFPVTVLSIDNDGIQVSNEAKGEIQWFYNDDGAADAEPDESGVPDAILVTPDDWRVKVLDTRRRFKAWHREVIDLVRDFSKDPTGPTSAQALSDAVSSWIGFTIHADPNAIIAENVGDYIALQHPSA